jgi:hypothetical protein
MTGSRRAADPVFRCFLVWLTPLALGVVMFPRLAAGDEPAPLIKRLDDATRAKVLAALAALIILGFAMVLLTWLGARVVQRYRHGTSFFQPTKRPGEHEWAKKPLNPPNSEPPTSDD